METYREGSGCMVHEEGMREGRREGGKEGGGKRRGRGVFRSWMHGS